MDNSARPALARRAFVVRALAAGRLITPFALPLTPPLSYWLVSMLMPLLSYWLVSQLTPPLSYG